MENLIEKSEKGILWILAFLLLAVTILGTVDLATGIIRELIEPPYLTVTPETVFHLFGKFLIILMGTKLIKLVLLSLPGESSPIVAVIEVGLIALSQKIVTMDIHTQSPASMGGMAALIFTLSVAHVACRYKSAHVKGRSPDAEETKPAHHSAASTGADLGETK